MLSTHKYGAKLRKLVNAAVTNQRRKYECSKCGKSAVKRKGYAKWNCKSCGTEFAGGAYSFRTETGNIARRMMQEQSE